MTQQETLYAIALAMCPHLKATTRNRLLDAMESAENVYLHRARLNEFVPEANEALLNELKAMDAFLPRAEQEMTFAQKGGIRVLGRGDADYPARLLTCSDAPSLLYYCGNAPLNASHVVSIVGTRKITPYGKDVCASFVKELSRLCPQTLVVSGLAYGVDVHAHRAALQNDLPTVGVLAHGLEQIYPRLHRDTAAQMVRQGGLLTEFPSGTPIDKRNFVQRNRIVAGICDVTLVVESAAKGGSLITAEMACGYEREVVAIPGRASDTYSAGCNMLIRTHRAQLVEDAQQLVALMGWQTEEERHHLLSEGVQQELFPALSADETAVLSELKAVEGTTVNQLALTTGFPISQLSSVLFGMEMKGLVKKMTGNSYRRA